MALLLICTTENNKKIVAAAKRTYLEYCFDLRRTKNADEVVRVIDNWNDFNNFSFSQFKPDIVLIQPELDWPEVVTDDYYWGYSAARQLLLEKSFGAFFNLRFISGQTREQLVKSVKPYHRGTIRAFKHNPLYADNSCYEKQYSNLHFDLLKMLVIQDKNVLNLIKHELNSLKSDLEAPGADKRKLPFNERLLEQLDELSVFAKAEDTLFDELRLEIVSNLKPLEYLEILKKLKDILSIMIQEMNEEQGSINKNKSNLEVVIIEDDEEWLRSLSETMQEMYTNVYPSSVKDFQEYNIHKIEGILKKKKSTNIFIIDLIYRDENRYLLSFDGLDIYTKIRKDFPYAVIRIISNIPRELVARIAATQKPSVQYKEVISKSGGRDGVRNILQDRALEMNEECHEMEQRRTAFIPIPKNGIFGWLGMQNWIDGLRSEQSPEYIGYWDRAFKIFDELKSGLRGGDIEGWNNGELPSNQKSESWDESYMKKKLPALLTHRLLLISYVLKMPDYTFNAGSYAETILEPISNYKSESIDRKYFAKIGFQSKEVTDGTSNSFKIIIKDLFLEEYGYLVEESKKQTTFSKAKNKVSAYPQLETWLKAVLAELLYKENWSKLLLPFNFYQGLGDIPILTISPKIIKEYNAYMPPSSPKRMLDLPFENFLPAVEIDQVEELLKALMRTSNGDRSVREMIILARQHYLTFISDDKNIPKHLSILLNGLN